MDRRITPSDVAPAPPVSAVGGPDAVLHYSPSNELVTLGEQDLVTTLDDWMMAGSPPIKEVDPTMPDLMPSDWFVANPK